QYVAESPDEVSCYILGFTLLELRQYEEAAKALRQTLEFNPRHVRARAFLGNALLSQGEKLLGVPGGKEQARELFRQSIVEEEKALSFQGDFAHAHMTRGLALKHLGRTEEALAALREAVLVGSDLPDVHQALGEALAEAGQM